MNLARDLDLLDAHIGVFDVHNLRRMDGVLLLLTILLALTGLLTLYSASRNAPTEYYYVAKQARYLLLGLGAAAFIVCLDRRFLVSIAPLLYLAAIVLLILVALFGATARGGQRWLVLGPLRIQPSELTKWVLIYMLAWYLTTFQERIRRLPYFLLAFVIVGVPGLLILKQPNLGTAATLVPLVFAMLYAAGCKRWHLAALLILALAAAPLAWSQLKDYQKDRVRTFLSPESDPQDKGWQAIQSKISVGSGGLTGTGFRQSTQTYLKYLPEHHTDFIFSLLAEEMGFVGAILTLGLFAAFLLRGLYCAAQCPDLGGSLLAAGVVALLGFHVFVNIAITVGLMPVTGIPLPFFSYGGSFYLTTMMCTGVLLNVHINKGFFG